MMKNNIAEVICKIANPIEAKFDNIIFEIQTRETLT